MSELSKIKERLNLSKNNMDNNLDEVNNRSVSQAELNIPPAHHYGISGGVIPKWSHARTVAIRPRGVRCKNPC